MVEWSQHCRRGKKGRGARGENKFARCEGGLAMGRRNEWCAQEGACQEGEDLP